MMNARRIIGGRWRSIAVLTVFAAMIVVCIAPTLAALVDATLIFGTQTPDDGATICDNHTTINVSIVTEELAYFAFNWNGTNYTYTTCGTEWDGSASSSQARTTTVGAYTQPDFDNIFPWSHIRRCTLWDNGTVNYYLNATNSSLKATGGLADLTGGDGQVMVEIPKFYVSHTYSSPAHDWKISRFNITGFSVHNAFLKNDTVVDYRYIGAYEGSMWDASAGAMVPPSSIATDMCGDGDKLCSVSGAYPKTNEMRSEFRDMAEARGGGWRQQDFDLISAVQLLYLIEYADFNSQSTIGMGRTEISGGTWTAGSNIGQCDKSNSDGDGTNSTDEYMTYRGIENFYGNVWSWVDGINLAGTIPWVCNDDALWVDDSTANYVNLGGSLTYGNGYQSALIPTGRGFLPAGAGAGVASNTYICDCYRNAAGYVVALGGDAESAAEAGAFCTYRGASTDDELSMGGRLAY